MPEEDEEPNEGEPKHVVRVRYRLYKRWKRELFIAECTTCFWQGQPQEDEHRAALNGAWHLRDHPGEVVPYDPLEE